MSDLARSYIFDLDELDEVIASPYVRVSKDESGHARSNVEQLDDAVSAVERKRTWRLGETYGDVGSASQWKRKDRESFERLLADLRAGRFVSHVLIIWEASRGSRSVPEWHELLTLLAERNVFVFVTSLYRLFNPRVAYDWKSLMDMGVNSEFEVRQLRERQARAISADIAAGRSNTGGRRSFGFKARGAEHEPAEAKLIVAAAKAIIGGDSVRTIAARWNAAGITTTAGNPWRSGPLANMLRSDRTAGLRRHEEDGKVTWAPIIDEITRRRMLAAMATRTPIGRGPRTTWELTGFLVCEHCGARLVANTDVGGTRRYVCRKGTNFHGCGKLVIKAADTEQVLGLLVTERLADAVARRSTGGPDDAAELSELAQIDADRFTLSQSTLSMAAKLVEHAQLDAREAELRKVIAAKASLSSDALDFIVEDGLVGRAWSALDVDEKRRIMGVLVERVAVGPSTRRGSTKFESDRVAGLLPDGGERIAWKA